MERHIASWSVMHPWQSLREGQQESEALGTEERRGEAMTGLRGRQEPSLAHGIESSVQVSNGKKAASSSIDRIESPPSNVKKDPSRPSSTGLSSVAAHCVVLVFSAPGLSAAAKPDPANEENGDAIV